MTTVSLRQFSRDTALKRSLLKNRQSIIVESRLGDGAERLEFLVIPLWMNKSHTGRKEGNKLNIHKYIGAWGKEKKPMSIQAEKSLIRSLWTKGEVD